jgi:DNA-directed RNA polymerase specialized sigma subunit
MMNNKIKTNYYNAYKSIINQKANLYSIEELEIEELIAQGNLIFCECLEDFEPEKNKSFSYYLNRMLDWKLPEYVLNFIRV